MTVIAARYALDVDPPVAPSAVSSMGAPDASCDFSGDGRLPRDAAEDRSAWTCPGFYLAMPTCALLMASVAIIRLYRVVTLGFVGGAS
ncbi:hypothetical protein [Sphingomonas faeni]|uniref:hypothetical protein n=1 Tax=Sphingomonas faeni TaxID=185950 RepID=UPI0020C7D993|nr:hypothetical protein [Sphingomonas faeni]MCP8889878.1 hypothetical protein [Sphingomonas faeni]